MPLPRPMMGRPGTPVIPIAWGESHSKVIDQATSTASTIKIGVPGTPQWDEDLGRSVIPIVDPVYSGAADLMAVSDTARARLVVEDPVKERVYEVMLPYAAGVELASEMVLTVDAGDPDPRLSNRTLRIGHIEDGSRRFSRVLLAVLLD